MLGLVPYGALRCCSRGVRCHCGPGAASEGAYCGRCCVACRTDAGPMVPSLCLLQFHDIDLGRMSGPAYDGVRIEDLDFAELPPLYHAPPSSKAGGPVWGEMRGMAGA